MATSREDIERWIEKARKDKMKFIISVCDTFDYDDYPVYCKDEKELRESIPEYRGVNMQRINEVIKVEKTTVIENFNYSSI